MRSPVSLPVIVTVVMRSRLLGSVIVRTGLLVIVT